MTRLGEIVMILDLHRQGAGVSAIAACRRRPTAIRRVMQRRRAAPPRRAGEIVALRSLAFYDAVARRLAGVGAGP